MKFEYKGVCNTPPAVSCIIVQLDDSRDCGRRDRSNHCSERDRSRCGQRTPNIQIRSRCTLYLQAMRRISVKAASIKFRESENWRRTSSHTKISSGDLLNNRLWGKCAITRTSTKRSLRGVRKIDFFI